jgi:pyridoxamine 5'-phosphate oxidase
MTDPIDLFRQIFARASEACAEPDAMVLSTVDADGQPSGRFVLLKAFDDRGFVFYTNLASRKAQALDADPRASLCFYWAPIGKQVRIEGNVEAVGDAEADAYFATRPRESQIGAWASKQSMPMATRGELDARVVELEARFEGRAVPRPPFTASCRESLNSGPGTPHGSTCANATNARMAAGRGRSYIPNLSRFFVSPAALLLHLSRK